MPYAVHTIDFEGPLEKLLGLIEIKKLDITTISLAEVVDDFIAYVETLEKKETRMLADFVSVAARLMLIKSKSLLPTLQLTATEEASIADLQKRLEQYKRIRAAARALQSARSANKILFSRKLFEGAKNMMRANINISAHDLLGVIKRMIAIQAINQKESRSVKKELYSMEEMIKKLLERLSVGDLNSFREAAQGRNRNEIVVLFLALLHLARIGKLAINQERAFDDIMITNGNEK